MDWLKSTGLYEQDDRFIADCILFVLALLLAYGLFYGFRWLVTFIAKKILSKTGSLFSRELLRKRFFHRLAWFPALIVLNIFNGLLFIPHPVLHKWLSIALAIAFVLAIVHIISALLNAINVTYNTAKYGGRNAIAMEK